MDGEHLVVSAPGKVILHGEHAVVHGKRALACSLDLRTFLHVTKSPDNMVRMHLPDIGIYNEWSVESISQLRHYTHSEASSNNNGMDGSKESLAKPPSPECFQALCEFCGFDSNTQTTKELAVISFLYLYSTLLPADQVLGLDFMVSSNLPTSAGLGSSAAFAVTLVSSLLRLSNRISHPGTESFNTWSTEDLEIINTWSFIAEKIIHGNPSGVDNSVSTYGGVVKYQNKQIEILDCKHELGVLVTNTKVPRSTKQLVSKVGDKLKQFPLIINPVLDAIEAISVECQDQITSDEPMNEDIINTMISDNHSLLCVLGVNHPELDRICRVTYDHGLRSKLTGAGGGGCAFTYLPNGVSAEKVDCVSSDLRSSGFDCWKTIIGGPGVGLHYGEPNTNFTIPAALQSRAKLCNIL